MIPDDVRCEICASRPAKLIMMRRRCADTYRTFVCPECANERTRLLSPAAPDLERIVTRLERGPSAGESTSYSCRLCGTTLAEIIADGKPGCCLCYVRFAGEIEQAARQIHDYTRHLGKAPSR